MPNLELQIYRAAADEAQALAHFSARIFPLGCPANTKPEDLSEYINRELTPERFRDLLRDDQIEILAVKIQDELAAFAMIARGAIAPEAPSLGDVELRKFYVDPHYHGRGVSNALMQRVLNSVETQGTSTLWLSVFSENSRAISFYKRWGFRITGTRIFLVGADEQNDYLMQRVATVITGEDSPCK